MVCTSLDVEIVKGHISRDHVHMLVSVPPYVAVSRLVQRMKGLTSRKLLMENRGLNKAFWGRHLWGRGYYVASTGNVTEEMIARYIETQEGERDQDADFKVGVINSWRHRQRIGVDRRKLPVGWFEPSGKRVGYRPSSRMVGNTGK
jgi:hypothetical protein